MTQKLILALVCCLVLLVLPVPQAFSQTQDPAFTWRDSNGNLHYQDEEGNYMINSNTLTTPGDQVLPADRTSDQKQDSTLQREKSSTELQTPSTQGDLNRDTTTRESSSDTSSLPSTAGELPALGLIGLLCLAGAATTRFAVSTRR